MPSYVYIHRKRKYHVTTEQLQNGRWICFVYPDPPYLGTGGIVEAPPTVGDPIGDVDPHPEKPGGPLLFDSETEGHAVGEQHVVTMFPPGIRG